MRRAWGVGMFPARVYVGQIIAVFAIVIVAIWGATQWAAAALGHQAALGTAWFTVWGYPVYLPWRLSAARATCSSADARCSSIVARSMSQPSTNQA